MYTELALQILRQAAQDAQCAGTCPFPSDDCRACQRTAQMFLAGTIADTVAEIVHYDASKLILLALKSTIGGEANRLES